MSAFARLAWWRSSPAGERDGRDIVRDGLDKMRNDFAADRMEVEEVEAEADFWLSVEACELCDSRQMCSGHFERFYGGW